MARSPWRDALDGHIAVLRSLRHESSTVHILSGFSLPDMTGFYPDQHNQDRLRLETARTVAEGWESIIRDAEPIHLTHDIKERVAQRTYRKIDTLVEDQGNDIGPLTEAMMPIRRGLIWLGHECLKVQDIPTATGNPYSVYVRAIYFGDAQDLYLDLLFPDGKKVVEISTYAPEERQRTGMGVMIFLDAQRSGYTHMTKAYGNHLVPVDLGQWYFGKTFYESVRENKAKSKYARDLTGATVLSCASYVFLHEMFMLMLQRVTRWGGVSLNREERKAAEHEKLRPRVQLVTWRKANYHYPEGHIPVPKNWSCRWSVKPHYRRYKSGKVIEIRSYIKGPKDKPFKLPAQRIHDVRY